MLEIVETLTPNTSGMDHLPPSIDSLSTENSKGRSDVWGHFAKQNPYSEKKAKCNYCGDLIKYLARTSGMRNHLARCKENPNREAFKRQKLLSSSTEVSVSPSPTISKFDQNASRMKLVKMFVKSELPFRFVENEDFRDLLWSLQPRFEVPSCTTLRHEIWELYEEEKAKLKMFLSKHCERDVQGSSLLNIVEIGIATGRRSKKNKFWFGSRLRVGKVLAPHNACPKAKSIGKRFGFWEVNLTRTDLAPTYLHF
ncbi:hypothetical protein V8G54_009885 [Vigna mungo]|uniref:BED-type domain-containing protein n=1 Tax=Vigna mungo TaxID=3915 RepID=A0AAQ3NWJ9_VIGMU